jgi:fibro-slime domain-containing protein
MNKRGMIRVATLVIAAALGAPSLLAACGSGQNQGTSRDGGASPDDGSGGGPGSSGGISLGDGGLSFGDARTPVYQADGAVVLPSNFVPTELGGYALGPALTGGAADAGLLQNGPAGNCSLVLGIVRDFLGSNLPPVDGGVPHPDFETFSGRGPTLGMVNSAIGTDRLPVYAGECDIASGFADRTKCPYGQQLTTKANFDEWYRNTPGVNLPYLVYLQFVPNGGFYTFQSNAYFPLDDAGFGNTPGKTHHNFSFTTELHLKFQYNGGETFSFTGDDDLWVFIDGKLAIDLGGLHPPVQGSVMLDTLGLTKGQEYDLELFNAERHTAGSDFRADTNLAFTSCGSVPVLQ